MPTGKLLSYDDVEKINSGEFKPLEKVISTHYRTKKGGRIELTDIKNRIKLIYENDEKFGWRLFYNGSADNYISLEPMTCMANCQNSPVDRIYSGFDSIAPYSSKEYISKIYLKENINENYKT